MVKALDEDAYYAPDKRNWYKVGLALASFVVIMGTLFLFVFS
jgi:hypothetical protein